MKPGNHPGKAAHSRLVATVAECCITLALFARLFSAVNEPELKSVKETFDSSCGRRNAGGVHTKLKAVDVLYIGGT